MVRHPHDVQPFDMVMSQRKVPYIIYSYLRSEASCTDIDVFLEPLMEDMAKLWNKWVHMWDQYQQEYFTLYAIIFICIMMLLWALHYQDRLKKRVTHVLFA
jgi:ABC-type glucose/galactose transport system permease subunit